MSRQKNRSFFGGTLVLMLSGILVKVIGAFFSIPLFKNVHQKNGVEYHKGAVGQAMKGLGATAKEIFANKKMFVFLLA